MESRENFAPMGIIFDMDGVIIDSNPLHKKAWRTVFGEENISISEDDFTDFIFGTTGDSAIRALTKKDLTNEEVNRYNLAVDAEYRSMVRQGSELEPVEGLYDFLQCILRSGHKTAVATSAPTENVDLVMDKFQLREYFHLIVDKTGITHGKPHPEIYLKTLEQMNMRASQCIVFEDSLSGIKAAVGAGIKVIGVTTSHSDDELKSAGAILTIRNFDEMSAEHISTIMAAD
jgi:beta-phosphoglucomutase